VSQKQRDREQTGILPRRRAGHTSDEHIELLADVEFLEQRVEQRARPREAACADCQRTHILKSVVVSPTSELDDLPVPVRWREADVSSACGSVAHGRHLRQSARL
jgi:hypothetical protein